MKLKRVKTPLGYGKRIDLYGKEVDEGYMVFLKTPTYFCEVVKVGDVIDVQPQLGYAIMAAYDKQFEELSEATRTRMIKDMEVK